MSGWIYSPSGILSPSEFCSRLTGVHLTGSSPDMRVMAIVVCFLAHSAHLRSSEEIFLGSEDAVPNSPKEEDVPYP